MKKETSSAREKFIKTISVAGVGAIALAGLTSCASREKKEEPIAKTNVTTTEPTVDFANGDKIYGYDDEGNFYVDEGEGPVIIEKATEENAR